MFRANRPFVSQMRTRNLLVAQLGAVAVAFAAATCMAGSARADDVGDLVVFQPQTPAKAADVNRNFDDIKTAVNSKSSDGIEFSSSDSTMSIPLDSNTVVSSVTITAPGPGFIESDFDAYLTVDHTQDAGDSYVICAIKTNTTSPNAVGGRILGSRRVVFVDSADRSGVRYPHISTRGVHTVDAAGTVTLNVVCRNTNSNSATTVHRSLTATYHSDRL